jgi:hypothetical protein
MADKSVPQNSGGQFTGVFTGGNVETLVYTGAGRLNKIHILTAGTAILSVYDGTQSTGGTLIYSTITNDVTGTIKDVQLPITTGIVVKGAAGTAGVCVAYNKDGPLGNAS